MDSSLTSNDRSRYSRMFADHVPFDLALDMARVTESAVRLAYTRDVEFLPGVKRDTYPIMRRAYMEMGFYNLANRYKGRGVLAKEGKNAARNYSHVELTSGSVIMISAAVDHDDDLVRDAVYRNTLAISPQLALPLGNEVEHEVGDALLAVVLYGPSRFYPDSLESAVPGFVVVRFPTTSFDGYAEGRINLLYHLNYSRLHQKPPFDIALWPEEMVE